MQQLNSMKNRIAEWKQNAKTTADFVVNNAAELVRAQ
jgi:hypothetical protein